MFSSFLQGLRPLSRILVFVLLCFFIGGLCSLLGVKLLKSLYGLSLPQDYALLQNFDEAWVLSANKFLLLVQHLGFFVLPGLLFVVFAYGKTALKAPKIQHKKMFLAFVLGLALYPLIGFLAYLNEQIPLGESLLQMEESAARFTMAVVRSEDIGTFIYNLFLIAVIPAVGEELVFRGILQREMEVQLQKPLLAIVFASVLFSTMHMQFAGFIPRFFLGMVLGWVYYQTRNIWVPIALHFANNALALTLVFILQPEVDSISEFDSFQWDLSTILFTLGSIVVSYFIIKSQFGFQKAEALQMSA
ncbi:MAG: lysostaphin resistance A-like protein, partial [Luteibaculum sp.]